MKEIARSAEAAPDGLKDLLRDLFGPAGKGTSGRIPNAGNASDFTWKIGRRWLTTDDQQPGIVSKRLYLMLQDGCDTTGFEMIMKKGDFHLFNPRKNACES